MSRTILTADIGGTNSRFGLFQLDSGERLSLVDKIWLPTDGAIDFGQLLQQVAASSLGHALTDSTMAVLAIAGPVERGRYSAPVNINWTVDLDDKEIADRLPQRCWLLNDFVAQGYACSGTLGNSGIEIVAGTPIANATIAVLGAGTGLGKAILHPLVDGTWTVLPSEGGHALFPFQDQREFEFLRFCQKTLGHRQIIANLVVSGLGLRQIHWFLTGERLSPAQVAATFTPQSETLAWMATFYGRICRQFALEVLARGGLYITGGVAAQNPEIVTHPAFRQEFHNSTTMAKIIAEIPVRLLDNQDSGLWGAAEYGRLQLRR